MKAFHSITITAAAVALLAFSAPVPAFSQMKDMPMGDHRGAHGHMMEMGDMDNMMGTCIDHADKLGLSDDQMAKITPVHREMQKKQARFKADLKIAEIEMMEIMEVKNFDLEKAITAVKKCDEIKTAHHVDMLKSMKEVRTILTDDQFKNMKKMMPMKGHKKPAKHMIKK